MKTREEKRWELMQEVLSAESRGDKPLRVSSQRTLFGIKSHVETVIDAVAAEDRKKCEDLIKSQRNNSDESATTGKPADKQAVDGSAGGQNTGAPADGQTSEPATTSKPADEQTNESATTGKPADKQAVDGSAGGQNPSAPADEQTSAQTGDAIPNETSEA